MSEAQMTPQSRATLNAFRLWDGAGWPDYLWFAILTVALEQGRTGHREDRIRRRMLINAQQFVKCTTRTRRAMQAAHAMRQMQRAQQAGAL